jgi:transposase-like protein
MDVHQERLVQVQRFLCRRCGKSFTACALVRHRSYSEAFMLEVTRRHVEGDSYRVIARDVYRRTGRKISPTSLQQMVLVIARRVKSAFEMSREFKPRWAGFLSLDEKKIPVKHQVVWCYGAIDSTGDVVHWRPVASCSVTEAVAFLEDVQTLGYPCRGLTSDLDTSFTLAIERVYPGKPHQYCIKHALAALEKILGYYGSELKARQRVQRLRTRFERLPLKKGLYLRRASAAFVQEWQRTRPLSARAREVRELRELCRAILCAKSQGAALDLLSRLRRRHSSQTVRKWKAVAFFERHWKRLMRHHQVKGLARTNNMMESFNKQLMRRLKTIESFQRHDTAVSYMNLLVAYLRLRPYTDCRCTRKHLNGKSRLQAAGVKLSSRDWLQACLKTR